MDMDMTPTPTSYRTRSSKRARSPSSPTQYDRPSLMTPIFLVTPISLLKKRFSSSHDTSVPIPLPPFHPAAMRLRGSPEDWVSQTQDLRLESPSLEQSRFSTPVEALGEVRIDEVMVDEPMSENDATVSASPPRPSLMLPEPPQSQYLRPPDTAVLYPHSEAAQQFQNPNQMHIPSIHVHAATPSPVQLFPHDSVTVNSGDAPPPGPHFAPPPSHGLPCAAPAMFVPSPGEPPDTTQAAGPPKKQRFTMGPRADCELCRMRVKGHYMHFD
ncbi:hypothetical protein GSI_07196 [Ganoderma sinense ZZ0214-1]|uniref:Uncharacterized protein n=1 Tax=Ganoderma sinense ZZ0214-1 TaxID=1077348 RepID=A0A2G8S9R0_9APHY|nr:hypothetical protein GSI_07196 [Ganoderma sinense ZZ0214-1]